MKNSNFDSF